MQFVHLKLEFEKSLKYTLVIFQMTINLHLQISQHRPIVDAILNRLLLPNYILASCLYMTFFINTVFCCIRFFNYIDYNDLNSLCHVVGCFYCVNHIYCHSRSMFCVF